MLTTIKSTWNSLNKTILVNQRELVLGVTACTLAGVVLGMLISPRKSMTVGSNNGSNNQGTFAPSAEIAKDAIQEEEE